MAHSSRFPWRLCVPVVLPVSLVSALLFAFAFTTTAFAHCLVQLSTDPSTTTTSQHQTEVEPDTSSSGSPLVSAFQVGHFNNGGASHVAWATSTNNESSWTHDFLPGTTVYAAPAGSYARVSDRNVVYDAAHTTWLVASLAINGFVSGVAVIVNRSTDSGLTWSNLVVVHAACGSESLNKESRFASLY